MSAPFQSNVPTRRQAVIKRIYVGNLPFSATEAGLRDLFAPHGEVYSVSLMTHAPGNLPRGFGFVEIEDAGLEAAVSALNGYEWLGRRLMVNEARERIDQD